MAESRQNTVLNGAFEFKRHSDGTVDKNAVVCNFCNKEFSYHRSSSSLKYHLNAKHFAVIQEFGAHTTLHPSASSQPPPGAAHQRLITPIISQSPTEKDEMDPSGHTEPVEPPMLALPPRRKRGRPRKQQHVQQVQEVQQAQQELLNMQRPQFDVLHRDLVVLRRSIGRMESRMVPLLHSISKSLERMADAFDYITSPATDGLSNSGLNMSNPS